MTIGDIIPGFYFGASDPETPDPVTYSLDTASGDVYFMLSSSYNALRINKRLDRDVIGIPPVLNVTIFATDMSSLTSSVVITITILDINDNSPVFTSPYYYVTVSRATAIGERLLKVKATDADAGANADLVYVIDRSDVIPSIVSVTSDGVVTLAQSMTSFGEQTIAVYLTVMDKGFPPRVDEATLFVSVILGKPEFSRPFYNFEIRSDAELNEPVGRITIYDRPSSFLYFLTVDNNCYYIDKEDGTIWPKIALSECHMELLYAIARDKLNTSIESKIVMIRIDTYTASKYLLGLTVETSPASLNTTLISTILDSVIQSVPSPGVVPRLVYINEVKVDLTGTVLTNDVITGTNIVITLLVLLDNKTENISYISEEKEYYDVTFLIAYLTGDSSSKGGPPIPGIFPVGQVSRVFSHVAPVMSWLDSMAGKVILTTTCILTVLAATTIATAIGMKKCRKTGKKMKRAESQHGSVTETSPEYDFRYTKDSKHVNVASGSFTSAVHGGNGDVRNEQFPRGVQMVSSADMLMSSGKILPDVG